MLKKCQGVLMLVACIFCWAVALSGCGTAPQKGPLVVHKSEASWAVVYHDIKSLKQNAEIVAIGTIAGVAQQIGSPPLVYTEFNFHISRVILDSQNLATSTIILYQTGAIVGNNLYEIEDDPLFQQGEVALLFLHQGDPKVYHVIGGPTGRFKVQNGLVTPINDEGVKFAAPMSEADFIAAIQSA